jgi:NDP-sugar pyrophosphorylase family protein
VAATGAVILASGPGTRLGELGTRMPKTMLPVAGHPYLEHLATRLLDAGLRPVVVAVNHLADMIRGHFANQPRWDNLAFVTTGQRGTGADLLDCLAQVPTDVFVVWNGDTVVDLDVPALLTFSGQDLDRGVIVLTRCTGVPNEGAFYVADNGTVLASLEAAPAPAIPSRFAWRASSTGVMLLSKPLLARFRSSPPPSSLEKTVLPCLISTRHLRAFDNGTRYFLDFGTPQGLEQLGRDAQSLFSGTGDLAERRSRPERRMEGTTQPAHDKEGDDAYGRGTTA